MSESAGYEKRTISLLRWVGYTLLLLSVFDVIEAFIPPGFMNPVWEFQLMGGLVERVAVPLIGLLLVFYGEASLRAEWEFILLKVLSWLSLLVGILYFLLIPLGISGTLRLYALSQNQANPQVNQRLAQLDQIKEQVNKASDKQIEELLARANQGSPPNIKTPEDLKNSKDKLLSNIAKAQETLKNQAEAAQENQRISLLKNAVKWNLGALIAGVSFAYIWRLTRWARRMS